MKLLSISEAARILGITRQAVDFKTRSGVLKVYRAPRFAGAGRVAGAGRRMVDRDEIMALLRKVEK